MTTKLIKKFFNKLGLDIGPLKEFDPTDPFNVPEEWVSQGEKGREPIKIVIGGGDRDYGPQWHNIEFVTQGYSDRYRSLPENIDIDFDLTSMKSFPIESETIEAAYTSHVIEHLQDEHVAHMFSEAFRVLKIGGFFRITCPDIDLYIRAFLDNDLSFFHYRDHPHYKNTGINDSIAGLFLDVFATSIANSANYEEISQSFLEHGIHKTLEYYKSKVVYDPKSSHCHVNYFNVEKLKSFLRSAGFTDIRVSSIGQSYHPDMRNLKKFDTQDFKISLFIECTK